MYGPPHIKTCQFCHYVVVLIGRWEDGGADRTICYYHVKPVCERIFKSFRMLGGVVTLRDGIVFRDIDPPVLGVYMEFRYSLNEMDEATRVRRS